MNTISKNVPTVEEYTDALVKIRPNLPKPYLEMLNAHYLHQNQTMSALQLAEGGGYPNTNSGNLHYGKLGKRLSHALGWDPPIDGAKPRWTMALAIGHVQAGPHSNWVWVLRKEVSKALDNLGWFPRGKLDSTILTDLVSFENELVTKQLDKTERETIRMSRIGQGDFRQALIYYWGKCAVTGCKAIRLLRASHIKPWRNCKNTERLDPYNGLLLQPNLDVAFDACLISFDDNGKILISETLKDTDLAHLGIRPDMQLSKIEDSHKPYLKYHRQMFANE